MRCRRKHWSFSTRSGRMQCLCFCVVTHAWCLNVQTDARISESNGEAASSHLRADSAASTSFQRVQSLQLPTSTSNFHSTMSLPQMGLPAASMPLPPSTGGLPPRSDAAPGAWEVKTSQVAQQEEPLQRGLDLIRRGSHPLELYTVNGLAQVRFPPPLCASGS